MVRPNLHALVKEAANQEGLSMEKWESKYHIPRGTVGNWKGGGFLGEKEFISAARLAQAIGASLGIARCGFIFGMFGLSPEALQEMFEAFVSHPEWHPDVSLIEPVGTHKTTTHTIVHRQMERNRKTRERDGARPPKKNSPTELRTSK